MAVDRSVEAAATAALKDAGLEVDHHLEFDGVLHRCGTLDKPNSKNGWYTAYPDTPICVNYGNWATGESGTWTMKDKASMTKAERKAFARRMEESRKSREAEQARIHGEAAEKAKTIYNAATACT